MSADIAGLRRDRAKAADRMNELTAATRGRSMTDAEQHDFDAAATKVRDLDAKLTEAEAEAATRTIDAVSKVEAAEIVKLCVEGGVPMMAASLIAEGASVEASKERIGAAAKIQEMVTLARRVDASIPETLAASFLSEGLSVEAVRTKLFDTIVSKQERTEIRSHVPQPVAGAAGVAASKASMERELSRAGVKKEA